MLNLGGQGMGAYGTGMSGGVAPPAGNNLQQLLALIQSRGGAGMPPMGAAPMGPPPTPLAPNNPMTPMANMITPQAMAAVGGGGMRPGGGALPAVPAPPAPAQMPQEGSANNMLQMLQMLQAQKAGQSGVPGAPPPQPSGALQPDNPNLVFNPNNPVGTQNLTGSTMNNPSWLQSLMGMFGPGSGAPPPA